MEQEKVIELLHSLSLKEKVAQLFQGYAHLFGANGEATGVSDDSQFNEFTINNLGSGLNIFGIDQLRRIQTEHLKHNKAPLIFMADVIYGCNTVFPIALAQGCSFNPELIKKTAAISARESVTEGVNVTFSPMADITRDARWGRCAEGYGEDPLLTSRMAKAMVEGYQGDDLSDPYTVASCVKHFAAYGATCDGKDYNATDMSERTLREVYLPGYKAAVDAGASLVMTSFNTINGIPATINKWLMKGILRDEWGFNGPVISDYGAILGVCAEGAANSMEECAKLSMEATVDIDMMDEVYPNNLEKLVNSGEISMQMLDDAVLRILELKNKLGVLDDPYKYLRDDHPISEKEKQEHLEFAKEVVAQSSVLLKNEDNILPLDRKQKIAFIGPYVFKNNLMALWAFMPHRELGITLKEAIEQYYPDHAYTYEKGCAILSEDEFVEKVIPDECHKDPEAYIAKAVEAAKKAEVVVLALGEHAYQFGESRSRTYLTLPKMQQKLFEQVAKVNDNIVVLLFNGRPLAIGDIAQKAKAVLDMWFPGSVGADAAAQMLFGDRVPSGKLSMSFPQSSGQCPVYYSFLKTGHYSAYGLTEPYALRYIDVPNPPFYAFGHGLSYTTFSYSDIRLSDDTLTEDGKITASIDVTNTGTIDAYETVQCYIRDICASMLSRPLKELKDFKKPFIKAGETVTLQFEITEPMLRFYNKDMEYKSEAGTFNLFIGAASNNCKQTTFTLK